MTLGEVIRAIESYNRRKQAEAKETALYVYVLADLIGKSNARIHSKNATYPTIEEAFPKLFDAEEMQEKRAEQEQELSAARFVRFAKNFNKRFGGDQHN